MATTRLKVLVSAYACSPRKGSEPGVGWGFVHALASEHDLWVLVEEEKFREDLEQHLVAHPEVGEHVRFVYVRKKRNRLLRKIWPPSYYWYYRDWHRAAFDAAVRLHREVSFDVAHQLTMVGFREPGYLWKLGIPFVWGPIGGMGIFPWRFLGKVGVYGALYYAAYNIANLAQMRFLARPRAAALVAGRGLIAATRENREGASRYWNCASVIITEVGLPRDPVAAPSVRRTGDPLTIAWSGQHIPRKALNLGLEALAKLSRKLDWRLEVLGGGSETARWRALASELGIADHCRFHGFLERDAALEVMRSAHVFLVTSLRDLTSTVVVEALALGLPVICPDHCGFADVVDATCGITVPVDIPRPFVDGVARALTRIAGDEPYRRCLATGAIQRAWAHAWPAKARQVNEVYRAVLAGAPRPVSRT